MKIRSYAMLSVLLVVFLDMLGIGLVIPLFSPLLLETNMFLPETDTFAQRSIMLGLLIGIYSFAQFLGSPIFGSLSDKYGRRPIMLISLWGRFFGYLVQVAGMWMVSLEILFIGRFITGFTGGNIAIAMSAVADVSTRATKSANFGYVGMAFAIGLVLGPFLGGVLSDPSIIPWFGYATPFVVTVFLSLFNIVIFHKYYQETLKRLSSRVKVDILMSFRNIATAFTLPHLRVMFLVVFLVSIGFGFFTEFYQVTLIKEFDFNAEQIGLTFAYVGFWVAISQGIINKPLSKIMKPARILSFSMLLASIFFIILILPHEAMYIYLILPFVAVFLGITEPNYNAVVSNLVSERVQGQVLGVTQSVQSLAYGIPPVVAGLVVALDMNLPMELAALMTFLAWAVFILFFYRKKGVVKTVV